jgi:hypothetical protein
VYLPDVDVCDTDIKPNVLDMNANMTICDESNIVEDQLYSLNTSLSSSLLQSKTSEDSSSHPHDDTPSLETAHPSRPHSSAPSANQNNLYPRWQATLPRLVESYLQYNKTSIQAGISALLPDAAISAACSGSCMLKRQNQVLCLFLERTLCIQYFTLILNL